MKKITFIFFILPLFLLTTLNAQGNDPYYRSNTGSGNNDDNQSRYPSRQMESRYQQPAQGEYGSRSRDYWKNDSDENNNDDQDDDDEEDDEDDDWDDEEENDNDQKNKSQTFKSNKNPKHLSENELKHRNYATAATPADETLRQKIKDKLTNTWFSKAYNNVDIEVTNGNVVLRGSVDSSKDLAEIEKRIKNLGPDVKNLRVQIQVQK